MRKSMSFILMFLIIINMVPFVGVADGGILFITSPKTISGKSGETIKIPITFKNTGIYDVEDISIQAEILDPGSVYLSGSAYDSIKYIEAGDTGKSNFNVEIDPLATKGTYKMNLKITYNGYETTEDTIYIRVDSKAPQLNITKLDILPNKIINPGEDFNIGIELENVGDVLAKDIRLSLEGLSDDGFSLSQGSNSQTIHSIPGGFKNYAVFQLKASKRISTGSHQLKLKMTYNGDIEDSQDLYLNVATNKDKVSNLLIENLAYPTEAIGQNKEVIIKFQLRNQGQSKANNIIISATSKDMNGLVPKSVSQIRINSINPEAAQIVEFKFLTTITAETRNYPIDINIEYDDDIISKGEKHTLNQFVGVFVVAPTEKDPADEIKSTPRLIIDRYDFSPTLVPAGENFSMNLSFFNTNSQKTVKNIKIFLTSDERTDPNSNSGGGSVFTPVDSSNTFYIDSIPPKGRVEKTITMFTVPDAQAKTYTLTANFEYEDNKGDSYTATELIGIPVIQQSKLETGELGVYPEAFVFQPAPVSIEFFNTGKVTLYNMMVKLEGDFQTENGSYYVGNFPSGSSEYFEGMVVPNQPGELTGDVVFTYEDSTGQEQEIRKSFTLNVMEEAPMPEWPGEEYPPMDDGGGKFSKILKSPWLWVSLVLIGGITGFTIYRKKKKEKELALDE